MDKLNTKAELFIGKVTSNLLESIAHKITLKEHNILNDNESTFNVFIDGELQENTQKGC